MLLIVCLLVCEKQLVSIDSIFIKMYQLFANNVETRGKFTDLCPRPERLLHLALDVVSSAAATKVSRIYSWPPILCFAKSEERSGGPLDGLRI